MIDEIVARFHPDEERVFFKIRRAHQHQLLPAVGAQIDALRLRRELRSVARERAVVPERRERVLPAVAVRFRIDRLSRGVFAHAAAHLMHRQQRLVIIRRVPVQRGGIKRAVPVVAEIEFADAAGDIDREHAQLPEAGQLRHAEIGAEALPRRGDEIHDRVHAGFAVAGALDIHAVRREILIRRGHILKASRQVFRRLRGVPVRKRHTGDADTAVTDAVPVVLRRCVPFSRIHRRDRGPDRVLQRRFGEQIALRVGQILIQPVVPDRDGERHLRGGEKMPGAPVGIIADVLELFPRASEIFFLARDLPRKAQDHDAVHGLAGDRQDAVLLVELVGKGRENLRIEQRVRVREHVLQKIRSVFRGPAGSKL